MNRTPKVEVTENTCCVCNQTKSAKFMLQDGQPVCGSCRTAPARNRKKMLSDLSDSAPTTSKSGTNYCPYCNVNVLSTSTMATVGQCKRCKQLMTRIRNTARRSSKFVRSLMGILQRNGTTEHAASAKKLVNFKQFTQPCSCTDHTTDAAKLLALRRVITLPCKAKYKTNIYAPACKAAIHTADPSARQAYHHTHPIAENDQRLELLQAVKSAVNIAMNAKLQKLVEIISE